MLFVRRVFFWFCVILASSRSLSHAQSAKPSEVPAALLEKRLAYQTKLSADKLVLLKQQLQQLLALEQKAAKAGDYESAIAAVEAQKKLQQQMRQQEKIQLLASAQNHTENLQEIIQLKLEDALLAGPKLESGAIIGWKNKNDSATWTLPGLPAGGYEVVLRYQSNATEGGRVLIKEARYSLKADLVTTLQGAEESNIGTLRIQDGDGKLVLSAESILGDNLMRLEALSLIPSLP